MEIHLSKYKNLYKTNDKQNLQEARRKALLKQQKTQRSQLQDELRGLEDFVSNVRQKCHSNQQKRNGPRTYKAKYGQDHRLQLSEWLKERPDDLDQWFLVPCPKGQRCMVISCDGYTEMYNKSGRLVCSFRTMLPGDRMQRNNVTILDCIYVETLQRFYVLDALAYGNQDFLNCDAQFRFFWLTSKFQENPLSEVSDYNDYSFVCLEFYDFADEEAISSCLMKYPQWEENSPELDGFLFYHKEASYTGGVTPLVGWLFPYMIPEVLNFSINEQFLSQRPGDYVDYLHFITIFDEKISKRNSNRRRSNQKSCKMDEDFAEDLAEPDGVDAILDAEKELEVFGDKGGFYEFD